MPPRDEKFRIWDAYWRDNRLYSAGADSDAQITQALEQQWALIGGVLPAGSRVLDLACGNGAVGLAMIRASRTTGSGLSITGIDTAAIDPPQYLPEHTDMLREIDFKPLTRMESLPFPDESFDAVVSQFGIEYGTIRDCLSEAVRVLKPYGLFICMSLPARSVAVHAAHRNLKQCRQLLRGTELFDLAIKVAQAIHDAEQTTPGSDHGAILQPFNREVENMVRKFGNEECDVVFAIILGLQRVFIDRKTMSLKEQIVAIQTLRTRLAEYAARAQALTRAALNDPDLEEFKRNVAGVGFKLTEVKPLLVGPYGTVAWRIGAERLPRA